MGWYLLSALVTLLLLPGLGIAQDSVRMARNDPSPIRSSAGRQPADPVAEYHPHDSPQKRLEKAVDVLKKMQSGRSTRALLNKARGVFIIPEYGEAALIIGSGGGEGVLLMREDGHWSNPAFYQAGSLSAGLQAGITAGSLALILMSEKAAAKFHAEHNVSLSLEAGLVAVDRSAWARGDVGTDADVLIWSDTEGLLAEFSVAVNSVIWQPEVNQDYYGRPVSPYQVLSGDAVDPNQAELQQALLEEN